ncbi:MAG: CDP-glycerol glycerophosphotransferase family protein [Synergistes sp.]|nr:CDP-glycerol glycerophosphotransferase family protein [Synergistes sp.]
MFYLGEDLKDKFSRVTYNDILHIFKFLAAFPLSVLYRRKRGHLWLLSEYADEARDNAYCLFKYLRSEHPEVDAVYAVNKASDDAEKAGNIGETVQFGSLRHWIYYLAAEVNISSQKGGNPNAAVCHVLEVSGLLHTKRVLLQHGVTFNDVKYLHYKNTRITLFICGAKPEYEFVKKCFGYPEGGVACAGMCRYDALPDKNTDCGRTLLVIPTWRKWIAHGGSREAFRETHFFKRWNEFLNSPELEQILKENKARLIFCPHRNMERFLSDFSCRSSDITLLPWGDADIQKLISGASMLITDYSSISADFAYMRRPLVYYQFDAEEFRQKHLAQSYFDYGRDGFGPLCVNISGLLSEISACMKRNFSPEEKYAKRAEDFFVHIDNRNCERNYSAIMTLLKRGRG